MKAIQMVDLYSQYIKIKNEVDNSIQEVINSTAFINGSEVKKFQKEMESYLDVKHVIPCGNGTDALQIAMMSLGLKPGDEVITGNFTFIATVEVIALLGLKPILVDVDPKTFNIDPIEIERAITNKTKAIVPVHLFGQCADMEKIIDIAEKHNLFIIEDTAQATGTEFIFPNNIKRKAGTIGHFGCTSFFPSKNLGCFGDGGAIFTNNDDYAQKARSIVNHGMNVRYYHDNVGVNSRLDSIQAAILRIKLQHLNDYNSARQKVALYYDNAFADHQNLTIPHRIKNSTHIFHQYTIITKNINRSGLIEFLKTKNIPAKIYYPLPVHKQKAYSDSNNKNKDFPVTENLCQNVLSLPMHTELDKEQLKYICDSILEYL